MTDSALHITAINRLIRRLKLRQLRLVILVAEHSSLLRAAEELNISQPAATKMIQDLEAEFKVKLFDRGNRGVTSTEFGRVLVKHSSLMLAQLSHANQELEDLREGMGGRIVAGTLISASAELLPAAISELKLKRPNVDVLVRSGVNDVLIPELQSGRLDMVVGRLPEYRYREQLLQEPLLEENMCVVAGAQNRLAGSRKLDFQQIVNCGWILPPTATTLRRQIDKLFLDHGSEPPQHAIVSVSYLINRKLLMTTDNLCVLPYSVIKLDVQNGSLSRLPVDVSSLRSVIGVSYRSDEGLSPAADAFLEEIRITAGQMKLDAEKL